MKASKNASSALLPSLFPVNWVGVYWRFKSAPELSDERRPALIYTSYEVLAMQGENGERWRVLCEQAANEQDPVRLMELVREINRLLEEKEERLQMQQAVKRGAA
jgi:hypothetical protein